MKQTTKTSNYKGGETRRFVRAEIAKRFGEDEAKKYDPRKNCFTFHGWLERGFVVKKGEHGIKSFTLIDEEEVKEKDGEKIQVVHLDRPYRKSVTLFYYLQVKKIDPKKRKLTIKNGQFIWKNKRGALQA